MRQHKIRIHNLTENQSQEDHDPRISNQISIIINQYSYKWATSTEHGFPSTKLQKETEPGLLPSLGMAHGRDQTIVTVEVRRLLPSTARHQ